MGKQNVQAKEVYFQQPQLTLVVMSISSGMLIYFDILQPEVQKLPKVVMIKIEHIN